MGEHVYLCIRQMRTSLKIGTYVKLAPTFSSLLGWGPLDKFGVS